MSENEREDNKPWKDGELLRELYLDDRMSMNQIRKRWDCSINTVSTWLDKYGIEKRSRSQSKMDDLYDISFYHHTRGYEILRPPDGFVLVHRLLAVAEYGFDAVCGMDVHHKNEIPWDNRPDNIELVAPDKHARRHLKIEEDERKKIADRYHNTDDSSYTIADDYPICSATVRDIYAEYYGDSDASDNGGEKAA